MFLNCFISHDHHALLTKGRIPWEPSPLSEHDWPSEATYLHGIDTYIRSYVHVRGQKVYLRSLRVLLNSCTQDRVHHENLRSRPNQVAR